MYCKSSTQTVTYFSEHPAYEVVVRHKVALYERHVGIGIELLVVGQLEEPSVGIEGRLEQFGEELSGGNCIKIGLPGKSILEEYFQENGTSQRPY